MMRFSQVGSKGGQRSELGRKREEGVGVGCLGRWICGIMVDPRQIVAGFLTFFMFAMLVHMIKRKHFDSIAQVLDLDLFVELWHHHLHRLYRLHRRFSHPTLLTAAPVAASILCFRLTFEFLFALPCRGRPGAICYGVGGGL
ncbi:hypothetical protein Droror1_Dr00002135 [Drosera rotundifolia]